MKGGGGKGFGGKGGNPFAAFGGKGGTSERVTTEERTEVKAGEVKERSMEWMAGKTRMIITAGL